MTNSWHEKTDAPAPLWHSCPTHGIPPENAWGCPECVRELREENANLRRDAKQAAYYLRQYARLRNSLRDTQDTWDTQWLVLVNLAIRLEKYTEDYEMGQRSRGS